MSLKVCCCFNEVQLVCQLSSRSVPKALWGGSALKSAQRHGAGAEKHHIAATQQDNCTAEKSRTNVRWRKAEQLYSGEKQDKAGHCLLQWGRHSYLQLPRCRYRSWPPQITITGGFRRYLMDTIIHHHSSSQVAGDPSFRSLQCEHGTTTVWNSSLSCWGWESFPFLLVWFLLGLRWPIIWEGISDLGNDFVPSI